jgi:hypothetical protein
MQTVSMFNTLNMPVRMSFIAVVIAIAAIGAVLEIGIINGSQAQLLQKAPPTAPSLSTSPPPSPTNTSVSPEVKSKLCDPNNPKLRFVNATESKICGIPKTMKNVTTTTPAPTSIPSPTPKPISPLSPDPITPPPSENPPQEAPIPGIP